MSFKNIDVKYEYRSLSDNIVSDFYIPLLNEAVEYKRAVGFFSSSALVEISKGISRFAKNGGKMKLIVSPYLSDEDLVAMKRGYESRKKVLGDILSRELQDHEDKFESERLNLLANLIADSTLDIKVAVIENNSSYAMYHEKIGIMRDREANKVAFSGSMNESRTAMKSNYETIDVFCSWKGEAEFDRVDTKEKAFDLIWNAGEPSIEILDILNLKEDIVKKYKKKEPNFEIDEEEFNKGTYRTGYTLKSEPTMPEEIKLRGYQEKAIKNWKENSYRGIFDMATGTGKTYTGLSAAVTLYNDLGKKLPLLIICPYQHLVTQWVEDIEAFGMKPIICHSASSQKNWKTKLSDACMSFELGVKDHFCAVFTNATYSSEYVQKNVKNILPKALLIVDEAHNLGASNLSSVLNEKIGFRLALSATIERHEDEEGTAKLFKFFEKKNIEYTLNDAIQNDMLSKYYYYPILVSFEEDELEDYIEISKKIAKLMPQQGKDNSSEFSNSVKMLLIKRARLVAAATQKISKLIEKMEEFKEKNHILIYCGATTMKDISSSEKNSFEEEKRQIDIVLDKLGNSLNMKVSKFTSEETAKERDHLKKEFSLGEQLQALVAIRCLDEGVNIPNIETAFILASSTNPKEYIQRRGRVLRKAKGKKYAYIYDFILSPIPIKDIGCYDEKIINYSKSLIKKEIERMKDFAELSENPKSADDIIYALANEYNLDLSEEDTYEQ